MFATSTKTATFFDTLSPIVMGCRAAWRSPASAPAPCGVDDPPENRLLVREPLALPARMLRRIVRLRRLDRRTSLVGRRSEAFLDEAVAHGFRFARRVDDEQVDGPDIPTGANRGPDREDGTADDVPLGLRNDDRGVGQEDQLAHEGRGSQWAGRGVTASIAREGDKSLDSRDPGRSDPVFHALWCSHVVGGAYSISRCDRGRPDRRGSLTAREMRM